jgi:hypothetical protein
VLTKFGFMYINKPSVVFAKITIYALTALLFSANGFAGVPNWVSSDSSRPLELMDCAARLSASYNNTKKRNQPSDLSVLKEFLSFAPQFVSEASALKKFYWSRETSQQIKRVRWNGLTGRILASPPGQEGFYTKAVIRITTEEENNKVITQLSFTISARRRLPNLLPEINSSGRLKTNAGDPYLIEFHKYAAEIAKNFSAEIVPTVMRFARGEESEYVFAVVVKDIKPETLDAKKFTELLRRLKLV